MGFQLPTSTGFLAGFLKASFGHCRWAARAEEGKGHRWLAGDGLLNWPALPVGNVGSHKSTFTLVYWGWNWTLIPYESKGQLVNWHSKFQRCFNNHMVEKQKLFPPNSKIRKLLKLKVWQDSVRRCQHHARNEDLKKLFQTGNLI